jgi:hypothetical protein
MGEWCLELYSSGYAKFRDTAQIFKYFAFFSMIFFSVLIFGVKLGPKRAMFIFLTFIYRLMKLPKLVCLATKT